MGSLMIPCGYAINAWLDVERDRRLREGLTDEQSWSDFYRVASAEFDAGLAAHRCGNPACLLMLHRNGKSYAYCRKCFVSDLAVANGYAALLDLGFTPEDASWIHEQVPCLAAGFPERCVVSIDQFRQAVDAWGKYREKYEGVLWAR